MVEGTIQENVIEVEVVSDLSRKLLPFPLGTFCCCLLHFVKQQPIPRKAEVIQSVVNQRAANLNRIVARPFVLAELQEPQAGGEHPFLRQLVKRSPRFKPNLVCKGPWQIVTPYKKLRRNGVRNRET